MTSTLPPRDWTEIRQAGVAGADRARWIAVLRWPRPNNTGRICRRDGCVDRGSVSGAGARIAARGDAGHVSANREDRHFDRAHRFPGTLTLEPEAALARWMKLGESIAKAGIRKFVMVTSHGGNGAAMSLIAQELRARRQMLAVTTAWGRLSAPETLFATEEVQHGIHGGAVETSIMLARQSEKVRRDAIADFRPATIAMAANFKWLSAQRPAPFAWQTQDLHPSGAVGNATLASGEKGERLIDQGAKAFCELLADVDRFDLHALAKGPKS